MTGNNTAVPNVMPDNIKTYDLTGLIPEHYLRSNRSVITDAFGNVIGFGWNRVPNFYENSITAVTDAFSRIMLEYFISVEGTAASEVYRDLAKMFSNFVASVLEAEHGGTGMKYSDADVWSPVIKSGCKVPLMLAGSMVGKTKEIATKVNILCEVAPRSMIDVDRRRQLENKDLKLKSEPEVEFDYGYYMAHLSLSILGGAALASVLKKFFASRASATVDHYLDPTGVARKSASITHLSGFTLSFAGKQIKLLHGLEWGLGEKYLTQSKAAISKVAVNEEAKALFVGFKATQQAGMLSKIGNNIKQLLVKAGISEANELKEAAKSLLQNKEILKSEWFKGLMDKKQDTLNGFAFALGERARACLDKKDFNGLKKIAGEKNFVNLINSVAGDDIERLANNVLSAQHSPSPDMLDAAGAYYVSDFDGMNVFLVNLFRANAQMSRAETDFASRALVNGEMIVTEVLYRAMATMVISFIVIPVARVVQDLISAVFHIVSEAFQTIDAEHGLTDKLQEVGVKAYKTSLDHVLKPSDDDAKNAVYKEFTGFLDKLGNSTDKERDMLQLAEIAKVEERSASIICSLTGWFCEVQVAGDDAPQPPVAEL